MKKLYTINTVNNFMDIIFKPFALPFMQAHPEIEIYNIMDDSLLKDTMAAGQVTPPVASRMLAYMQAAQSSGADGVIVTCTSVNAATAWIRPLMSIPVINIEEPVAQAAVENGMRIGVLSTLRTSPAAIGRTIQKIADENGKRVEMVIRVVDGAFDALCAGDRAKHDGMVNEALYHLADEVDVIAFAQISMSLLKHDPVKVPLYKIGMSGFDRILDLMNERG